MATLTLVEASKNGRGDVVQQAVIEMFARESDILAALPFEDIPGGVLKYEREGTLPGVAFRGVGEAYVASAGVLNPLSDATYIIGGDVDVDNYVLATRGMDQWGVRTRMKVKSIADSWAQKFVKGDNSTEVREFDGLQTRLVGSQVVSNSSASGGAALSMKKLDELIDAVDSPTHLVTNKAMVRNIKAYLRTSSMIAESEDAFGRKLTTYSGLPILTTNNGSTEALAFSESYTGGGTANGTSVYCVSFGAGRVQGIQNGGISVRDLGEVQSQPLRRLRIEWYAGLAVLHGRAAARLRDISDLTAIA